jgi:hypothetical protein
LFSALITLQRVGFWLALTGCGYSGQEPPGGASSSDDPTSAQTRICDGSSGLKFGTWIEMDPSRIAPASSVLYELGSDWLYIDGQCRYWAHVNDQSAGDWKPAREGVLSEAEAKSVAADFFYSDWPTLSGLWVGLPTQGSTSFAP